MSDFKELAESVEEIEFMHKNPCWESPVDDIIEAQSTKLNQEILKAFTALEKRIKALEEKAEELSLRENKND